MTAAPGEFVLTIGEGVPIVALVVRGFLGAYVFGLTPRGAANRSVLFVMFAFALWDVGEVVQRAFAAGTSPDSLFFWARGTWLGLALVPAPPFPLALTY